MIPEDIVEAVDYYWEADWWSLECEHCEGSMYGIVIDGHAALQCEDCGAVDEVPDEVIEHYEEGILLHLEPDPWFCHGCGEELDPTTRVCFDPYERPWHSTCYGRTEIDYWDEAA